MPRVARRIFVGVCIVVACVAIVGLVLRGETTRHAPTGQTRIVVLSPALAVMLADLGLEGRIVGRHGWDIVLDKAVPVCGDQGGLNYEALIEARPTHVLLEWPAGQGALPRRLTALAEEHEWIVRNFHLRRLDDIGRACIELRTLFEDEARPIAPEARTPRVLVEAMLPAAQGEPAFTGRVLMLMSVDPPMALGPGSFHHELLMHLGAVPAIERGGPAIELDAEDILDLSPDAIVLFSPRPFGADPGAYDWSRIEFLFGATGELPIPAIEDRRVAVIDHPLGLVPATSIVECGDLMRRALRDFAREP